MIELLAYIVATGSVVVPVAVGLTVLALAHRKRL